MLLYGTAVWCGLDETTSSCCYPTSS